MRKKYVFLDVDGTLLDHSISAVPKSALKGIEMAKKNGHEMIINTGRPPCLFYGIDKQLKIDSYVAANGTVVVYKGELIYNNALNKVVIKQVIDYAYDKKIDIALQGFNGFKLQTQFSNIYKKFCKNFNIELPELQKDYYLDNDIYQMTLFYQGDDYKEFESLFPELSFEFSCEFGLDVNAKGGLKERGIKVIVKKLNIDISDVIVIGDGHNDISMLKYVKNSVAMGNAHDEVKKHASFVTDHISNDGLYKAFEKLKLIEKN